MWCTDGTLARILEPWGLVVTLPILAVCKDLHFSTCEMGTIMTAQFLSPRILTTVKWDNAPSPHGAAPLPLALHAPHPWTPQSLPVTPQNHWEQGPSTFQSAFLIIVMLFIEQLRGTLSAKGFHDRAGSKGPQPWRAFSPFSREEMWESESLSTFAESHI